MGDMSLVEGISETMEAKKKRSLDTYLRDDAEQVDETPSKRPYYAAPDSLSSRVTDWLSQLPLESPLESPHEADPDMVGAFKKDKSHDSVVGGGGLATPSIASASGASRPPTGTGAIQSTPTSTGRLVERANYRENLEEHNIFFLTEDEPIPNHISAVCDSMRNPRSSPEPTPEEALCEMETLKRLQHRGAIEGQVQHWFEGNVFPDTKAIIGHGLEVIPHPMFQHCIPNSPNSTAYKVSKPNPDLVYGYATDHKSPFTGAQRIAGNKMDPKMGKIDSQGHLAFPFFVIEFKGDGQVNGSLWVATNQCLDGSATCTETVSRLNYLLQQYPGARPVGNMAFSIAMSQNSAELYVSWKTDELAYYTREAAAFYLKRPEDFLEFRRYVKNILDWGKGPRLRELQEAFDFILEEDRKIASAQAKQRPAPSSGSSSSTSSKRVKIAQAGTPPPVAPGASSSRMQPDRNDRHPAAPAGYQSPSVASGSKSYQSGSYAGSGGARSGSGAGSGRDTDAASMLALAIKKLKPPPCNYRRQFPDASG
ncbi:hypothetical protein PG993_003863 [Apiospora rasikravindrae]|uniref:DUF7924 domain-containing protein n=1 Tax=Apiospora rasikravindrae TaxID=990691 RepID=A0ABR1U0Z7_9PEZI